MNEDSYDSKLKEKIQIEIAMNSENKSEEEEHQVGEQEPGPQRRPHTEHFKHFLRKYWGLLQMICFLAALLVLVISMLARRSDVPDHTTQAVANLLYKLAGVPDFAQAMAIAMNATHGGKDQVNLF